MLLLAIKYNFQSKCPLLCRHGQVQWYSISSKKVSLIKRIVSSCFEKQRFKDCFPAGTTWLGAERHRQVRGSWKILTGRQTHLAFVENKRNTEYEQPYALSFLPSYRMLQIQVHMESSQPMSRQSGTEACLSSSTMMLASRPSDCQCVDFSGPSSYLSRKNRGWLWATVWNIWTRGEEGRVRDTHD